MKKSSQINDIWSLGQNEYIMPEALDSLESSCFRQMSRLDSRADYMQNVWLESWKIRYEIRMSAMKTPKVFNLNRNNMKK